MTEYCQNDPRWKDRKIANTKLTMGHYGCYISAIAYFTGKTPGEVLGILNRNKCFTLKGLLDNQQSAKVLGMTYHYLDVNPGAPCVCETNHYKPTGVPQHFFVWLNDGEGNILDPLDGEIKKCRYKIVSYRLWVPTSPEFRAVNVNYTPELMAKKQKYCFSMGLVCSNCKNSWCKEAQEKLKNGGELVGK